MYLHIAGRIKFDLKNEGGRLRRVREFEILMQIKENWLGCTQVILHLPPQYYLEQYYLLYVLCVKSMNKINNGDNYCSVRTLKHYKQHQLFFLQLCLHHLYTSTDGIVTELSLQYIGIKCSATLRINFHEIQKRNKQITGQLF